jgi:hypothetical protein
MKKGLFPPGTSFKAYLPSPDRRHNAVATRQRLTDCVKLCLTGYQSRVRVSSPGSEFQLWQIGVSGILALKNR